MLSCLLRSTCLLFLSCILCDPFFALSLALYFVYCVFCLVSRSSEFCFCLSTVNLLVFSLYIISHDKQSYVELAANKYRCLVWRCQVSCTLYLLSRLLRLHSIFCIASLALSLAFCLRRCIFLLVSCLSGFHFCLSIVDLLVFFLYIVSFDKQFYVELAANQYRDFVRCCRMSCSLHLSSPARLRDFLSRVYP